MVSGLTSQDPIAQMNTYRSFVSMLVDPGAKDENKLKAAQELSENFETIVSSPQYPAFLEHAVRIFLKILQDGEPHFLAEYNVQQLRKLILEILHRIPTNEHLRPFAKQILSLMFKFLETENEENVLVCLRIIIELHKQFRPQYNVEIQHFLQFVKTIYKDLPNHLNKIFEPRASIKVKDLNEMNTEALLLETFTITTVQTEKKNQDGTLISYNLIPKAVLSLKVLAELPIIVVLMYQLYKPSVHMEVSEFIPLIMNTIVLQPAVQHRSSPTFNKEVFVDFMAAQVKTLSFLAYIIRVYQDMVNQHANMLVKGMLGLLALCPHEVAHLRKELLIAARHILATDLRNKFVPFIERLFDEYVLIGTGWTTHESLRPLAYSTLADLVHHVRQQLPLSDLAMAVNLFTKNVHDESLPTNIQTMSCKLLLNLVDCIRQKSEQENGNGRDLLMRMLEVFVLKFKTIAKLQLPTLTQKWSSRPQTNANSSSTPSTAMPVLTPAVAATIAESPTPQSYPPLTPCLQPMAPPPPTDIKDDFKSTASLSGDFKDDKPVKFGFPSSPSSSYTVVDCRSLVKTLVCGVKTITWGVTNCKTAADAALVQNKQYQPKETLVFIRLFKYAMKALDIYTLATTPVAQLQLRNTPHSIQTVRSKEEKEVLEHFAGVFTMMNPQTFKEIFTVMINYMVERINKNYALQIISNSFLSNPSISPIFATILIEYLLERMEEMGSNLERSNLYLKLFKLVFGSVSLFAAENELMLKPHLHQIVIRSMELAMSAKEPYNYYLLLRALFRSIGGGSHDQLYQEFLPLLPNLLQGLNSLQSGLHKQHMKDLFVELCLTVPVRLSSLLPYLPMLMDPLVSALNGSQTLVSQGLRTLELCVDNLQPDFLYEHIQPVRAELMQALWRTVRNPLDANSQAAFRVLGKFGGSNRKMLAEPQKLDFQTKDSPGPCLAVYFNDQKTPISLPIEKVIETAFNALKLSSTEPFYRRQSWEVLRCFLIAAMQLDDDRQSVQHVFSNSIFTTSEIASVQGQFFKSSDEQARKVHEMALTGLFVATAIKELNPSVLPLMGSLVRHYTMVAICQQCGPVSQNWKQGKVLEMDPLVLIDALAAVMGHEEKELCKPGHFALVIILDTANNILGTKERTCQLPFLEYLVERLCALCYERAWYAKLGGCIAIKFLLKEMVLKWVFQHHFVFLKALLFVMMDLTGEVSSGAVDMAKANLERMLTLCATPIEPKAENEDLIEAQKKSLHEVTHELVRQVTSPNTCVREQAMHSLEVLAKIAETTVTDIMEPHKEVLADMIPPKKHVLRHQPANAQIGLMEGNTFCTTLQPRLFTIDVNIKEHNVFITDMLFMCDTEDTLLLKLPCLKSVQNLIPLRKSALRGLAACQYIAQYRDKIFAALFKALNSNNAELQETAFECMKKVMVTTQMEMETVHQLIRPMLLMLGDYRNLNLNVIQRLSYLTQLFANTFNDKLCEQLLAHLKKWLEVTIATLKGGQRSSSAELKICMALIGIFHQIPAASQKFIDPLVIFVLKTERALMIEAGSPFRDPLAKFLVRYPTQTVDLLLGENYLRDRHYSRFLEYLLNHKDGKPFREVLQSCPNRLLTMALGNVPYPVSQPNPSQQQQPSVNKYDLQYFTICVIHTLVRRDDQWLGTQTQLVATLRKIWISDEFQERHAKVDTVDYSYWKEPKLLVKCLLNYIKIHPLEIELLFQLLRALTGRFIPDFQFLKDFLEKQVAKDFTVEWKRKAFFTFVDHFHNQGFPQDLKAKILQYIVIPSFSVAFDNGEEETLIGGPPAPDQDLADNVISVFINKLIDPENPFGTSDAVRILLLQLSCLLVEQASPHIHDAANKRQGNKLRRLMTFAWPCLLGKNCVDPATKYHGHLLLAHIIAKFAIHKRIVLQVFHSLLKAHAVEARSVVRQALEILTPAMPQRMEDGNTMLTHWTKKIIMEEGHMVAQLVHMLQLLVRHHKVYYPVRHHLLQHMVNSMQRLGVTPSATIENKKLAVDLAEVVLKWELQRMKEDQELTYEFSELSQPGVSGFPVKRSAGADGLPDAKRVRHSSGPSVKTVHEHSVRPIDKVHSDAVVNFLLRIACQVNEATTAGGSPGELLSRRCVNLLKGALKPDVWPNTDLKLAWFDKLLMTVETPQPNIGNICTALELLSYLLTIIKKDAILAGFKPLQRGIAACMTCPNSKVIRSVHWLLSRLMSTFPTEPLNSSVASKHEELECLYACVGKVVYEGLANYEKNPNASPSSLFGTLMILKAACTSNPCYIDRLITSFMRVLQRMAKEHLSPTTQEANSVTSELLILSLDLVKNRVGVMGQDMRKAFIGSILVGLIEKTQDVKVMRAITKMVEEWVKNRSPIAINQSPSLREKSILLVKMMQYIEKRFPTELELNAQFLELVNYVYREETLKGTELMSKLEVAFMAGLRCVQPQIRAKFFEVFDQSMRRRLHDRLLYIICSQSWEPIGRHYWIKQCLELLMATALSSTTMQSCAQISQLPSLKSLIAVSDGAGDVTGFGTIANVKEEPLELEAMESSKEDEIDIELSTSGADEAITPREQMAQCATSSSSTRTDTTPNTRNQVQLLIRHVKFLEDAREMKTVTFLNAAVQLCHMDTNLAQTMWLDFFPRVWKILSERQQHGLAVEVIPFLSSGSHVIQKDCQPSAINTFMEAISHCEPAIPLKPSVVKYLGKSHNLWHRAALVLEQMANESSASSPPKNRGPDCYDFEPCANPQQERLDAVLDMYCALREEDMWAGLWQKRAKYADTAIAVSFEQQGHFEQAQASYELAMTKLRQDYTHSPTPVSLQSELRLLDHHWIRCAKELNQWDSLLDYGNSRCRRDSFLVLESAWRVPDWTLMKDALTQVEMNCPEEMAWKVNLYRGFLAVCHADERPLTIVERLVEVATNLCIKEWRRLPHVVSHIHVQYLQAAQQIGELQEAAQINQGLLPANIGRPTYLQDMKSIVKTWRNRLPIISDDLSHWSEIFMWRQHHYQAIVSQYDVLGQQQGAEQQNNHSMLGVHASAQAIIHFGKIARKHGVTGVCLDSLNRIYTIPSVPIVDCFQKIRQQVKCYLQMSGLAGKTELQEGLDAIESTNLGFFQKEMTAEFYALKGTFLAQIGRSEEANKAFSASVRMHDTLVKAWALWGDYLEQIFAKDRNMPTGVNAVTCFLHACRHQNESKSRKYLAKVLWLLSYDDKNCTLAEAVEKYSVGVPPLQWLLWIPQLLTCLVRNEGRFILGVLSQVGKVYPQAVYFPIRTLYLTLKIEQRERYKSGELIGAGTSDTKRIGLPGADVRTQTGVPGTLADGCATTGESPGPSAPVESGTIKATASMWRCSRTLHMQRDLHPTILSSLEGIVDQMVWFRENWYEEVLRQLRQGLAKCHIVAFENRGAVASATVTPHTLYFVKKLVSTFGVGLENFSSSVGSTFASAASESLARRAQATAQDPVFQRMKGQFTADFDFNAPGAMKLHNLINKLKKWIKILEAKIKILPKSILIEEKCRFLSNFSQQTAEVEIPGEFLLPKSHYNVKIVRFMPRVEIVHKHNTAARRLYIRGHNGKIYPYLVVNDVCMTESRREERVLQLLRMLNHYPGKQKETSRRLLNFTVPRVVAVSPQMRLVEDNPCSISLLDIYKQICSKNNVEHDGPIARYYERLAAVQSRGSQASHQVLRDILKEVQTSMVPRDMLKKWALRTFPSATDYWTFRKMFTLQLALAGFAEFVLHLSRLNPDMIYVHQDSGLLNCSYFRFDIEDATGDLEANRPVPFRLTPNITEFVTTTGVSGPLTAAMIAMARCLVQPNYKVTSLLRAILRDEIITWHKKKQDDTQQGNQPLDMEGDMLVTMVNKAVNAINSRLQNLATFDGAESKVSTLVAAANSHDNLCRMDPAWHPWL